MVQIAAAVMPVDGAIQAPFEHPLGHVLDPGEAVDQRIFLGSLGAGQGAEGKAKAAIAHHHGGGAVADGLGQRRLDLDLEVEVGVDVEQPRHQPLALAIDHGRGRCPGQIDALGGDLPILDRQIDSLRRGAGAIEDQRTADQGVPDGLSVHGHSLQGCYCGRKDCIRIFGRAGA
jgi:hypothetical protein